MNTVNLALPVPENDEERAFVAQLYSDLASFFGGANSPATAESAAAKPAGSYDGPDTEPNLRRLLTEVHGENARRALRAIADVTVDGGAAPTSDTVRERLGMEIGPGVPNKLGGMLTSVGFALRRTGLDRPYVEGWDGGRRSYLMTPGVGKALRQLVNEDGSLN